MNSSLRLKVPTPEQKHPRDLDPKLNNQKESISPMVLPRHTGEILITTEKVLCYGEDVHCCAGEISHHSA
jgi:hypothetical protein